MKNIFVTGVNGFIGQILYRELLNKNYKIKPELDEETNAIIHLAARVHIMQDKANDPLAEFRKSNVELTKNLAEQAVKNGVGKFIFISSLHVNGVNSTNKPFQETDQPNPKTPYAVSKLEAEKCLYEIAEQTGLEIVVIRPPLVYGPNVKGNFLSLLSLINKGIPFLPFGALDNKRSFIGINNLVDFIICCIEHPQAAGQTFLISDDEDITTTDLIKILMKYTNKKRPLLPISEDLLSFIGKLVGRKDAIEKLCAPLQVNIDKAKQLLNWQPVQPLTDGVKETISWYNNR